MKQYDVKISHAALSDMEQIYSYLPSACWSLTRLWGSITALQKPSSR